MPARNGISDCGPVRTGNGFHIFGFKQGGKKMGAISQVETTVANAYEAAESAKAAQAKETQEEK